MKSQQATQVDAAIQAGVTQSTGSLALSWSDSPIHNETRQRLLDVFYRLGYVSNTQGQRFEPLLHTRLTKIYQLVQNHKNLINSLIKGKGGGVTSRFRNIS